MPTIRISEFTVLQIVGLDAAVVSAFLVDDHRELTSRRVSYLAA